MDTTLEIDIFSAVYPEVTNFPVGTHKESQW